MPRLAKRLTLTFIVSAQGQSKPYQVKYDMKGHEESCTIHVFYFQYDTLQHDNDTNRLTSACCNKNIIKHQF